jgi:hypothetical protein
MRTKPTPDRLRELFNYDPDTGLLTRRASRNGALAGSLAGSIDKDGYRWVRVDGARYAATSLIWTLRTGEWPKEQIDHRDPDGPKCDFGNRWENLRPASPMQNRWNSRSRKRSGTSVSAIGVEKKGNRFRSVINVDRKRIRLGYFKTETEAALAYDHAAKQWHGEFAYINFPNGLPSEYREPAG